MININKMLKVQKWLNDLQRRSEVSKYLDFYENNDTEYIKQSILKMYPKTGYMLTKYIESYALTENLINDLAIAYDDMPDIQITNNETLSSDLNNILDILDFSFKLKSIDKYTNLTYKTGIMPLYRNGKIVLEVITPDICYVEQNSTDPGKIDKLFIEIDKLESTHTKAISVNNYMMWTDEYYQIVEVDHDDGTMIEVTEPTVHNFGTIPVVWFVLDNNPRSFWPTKKSGIIDAHEKIAIDITNINYIMAFQAFSTLATFGLDEELDIEFGPGNYLNIPNDPASDNKVDAKYLSPNPKLQIMWDIVNKKISNAAISTLGTSEGYANKNTDFNSGFQLLISKSKLYNKVSSNRQLFDNSLHNLIYLIMKAWNIYMQPTFELTSINLEINYPEFKTIHSEKEKLEIRKLQIEVEQLEERGNIN